jgi:glycosyltransferase involved in cell wall biosynthesis
MAACWRALQALSGIELSIIAYQVGAGEEHIAFGQQVMKGLNFKLLNRSDAHDPTIVAALVQERKPDVIVVPGWFNPAYSSLPSHAKLADAKFVMTMDTPWRNELRQKMARLKIGSYLDRMDLVVVAGERAWQYARHLRIPESKLLRGVYGFDAAPLEEIFAQRKAAPWPRRFLYVGRYVQDKAIDVMLAGYAQYRAKSKLPWPLVCCGQGVFREQIAAADGVSDRGFVQPGDLPRVLAEQGAFVIVSRYEPWGVAIAEAMYSGLPAICSEACGASVSLLRDQVSGLLVPTEDPAALARAMLWMEQHLEELPRMGESAKALAKPFSAEFWAKRWKTRLDQLA